MSRMSSMNVNKHKSSLKVVEKILFTDEEISKFKFLD